MGANFFPDGLARILSLIRSSQVAQGCQTAPVERLGPLRRSGGSPGIPRTRDVHVQVAGGIDSEDEPLMEQQVRFCACQSVYGRKRAAFGVCIVSNAGTRGQEWLVDFPSLR